MIKSFTGDYAFLSNYYHFPFEYEGIEYNNVVCAFVAQFLNTPIQKKTVGKMLPAQAVATLKKYSVKELSEEEQLDLMKNICKVKFSNKELKDKLLETQGELINETTWENSFWGTNKDKGENHLGLILEEIRSEFQNSNNSNNNKKKKKNKDKSDNKNVEIEEVEEILDDDYESGNAED